jgi:putative flippase GtrA
MNENRLQKVARFARSAGIGVLASGLDVVALFALVEHVGLAPEGANVPALALGLLVQFFGNKYFAFRDRSRALVRQGVRFAAVEVGALLLNAVTFFALMRLTALPYLLARVVCSAGVYAGYSFPLWGLVFRPGGGGATTIERQQCSTRCSF